MIGSVGGFVGQIIGIFVGGIAGGIAGRQLGLRIFSKLEKKMNRKEVMGRVQLDLKDFKTSKYIDGLDVPGGSNAQDDDFRLSQLNVPTR